MATVADTLADPLRRKGIRALWLSALLEGVTDAEDVQAARVGDPVEPQERSYGVDGLGMVHTWTVAVPYPRDAATVQSIAFLDGGGELLAVGGTIEPWSTTAQGGWAVVTVTVQRGDVWPL